MNPIREAMVKMSGPIVDLAEGISYMATYLTMIAGCMLFIVGQRKKGMEYIKWAVVGYILLHLLPGGMQLVQGIGDMMKQSVQDVITHY